MCNIHCDRIAAFNCCRGLSILILIIVIDFIRNETLRLFGIMSIVIIVMSFICYDTSHLRRTQANRRRNEGRNEENNRDIIVLEIINRNIDREVLNLLRTRTFSYKLGHTDPHIGDECCICLDEYKKKSKVINWQTWIGWTFKWCRTNISCCQRCWYGSCLSRY